MSEGHKVYFTKSESGQYLAASVSPCFCVAGDSHSDVRAKAEKIIAFHHRRMGKEVALPQAWASRAETKVRQFAPIAVETIPGRECVAA